ncbi:MAG: hypothetical protein KAX49_12920 [Halanaerobiales bacterium]|nr:hypothetical protein [Halanaerobiales bacterium]
MSHKNIRSKLFEKLNDWWDRNCGNILHSLIFIVCISVFAWACLKTEDFRRDYKKEVDIKYNELVSYYKEDGVVDDFEFLRLQSFRESVKYEFRVDCKIENIEKEFNMYMVNF